MEGMDEATPLLSRRSVVRSSRWHRFREWMAGVDSEEKKMIRWLDAMGMSEHAPEFIRNGATLEILPSIQAEDMRSVLGVRCLRHRRLLLDAIRTFESTAKNDSMRRALPEDARTLTHLQNTRVFIASAILVIQTQTLSLALLFLSSPEIYKRTAALTLATGGLLLLLRAASRYFQVKRVCESVDPASLRVALEDLQTRSAQTFGALMLPLLLVVVLYSLPLDQSKKIDLVRESITDGLLALSACGV